MKMASVENGIVTAIALLVLSLAGIDAARAQRGLIKSDGSKTGFPITEAVAEEFQKNHKDIKVTVGISGTGGGFKKFCNGETDISDAARPITPSEGELFGPTKR